MNFQLKYKLDNLLVINKQLKPRTIYHELAEDGILEDYLKTYMPEKFSYDEKFQNDVLDLVFAQSNGLVPDIQLFILEKISESLQYFIDGVGNGKK